MATSVTQSIEIIIFIVARAGLTLLTAGSAGMLVCMRLRVCCWSAGLARTMSWAILAAFLTVIGIMSLSGRKRVPWAHKLRRINAGVAHRAEWMAPEKIVEAVRSDYLAAMRWLPESMLYDWSQQWSAAPEYLSGLYLKRHQEILQRYHAGQLLQYVGVMRCVHQVEVRQFSDDGERCLLIDQQTSRRMATYDYWTQQRLNTQDIGDCVIVYEMAYDKQANRWKIDRFVQELPTGWRRASSRRLRLLSVLPPSVGRDH
jgi:hypothetical protein